MALKMRFLYYSGKSKMKAIAEAVKTEFELTQNYNAIDIIPPAYSCENERLVILAISGKGEPEDMLRRFCCELNKKKAQNIALIIDGDQKMADKISESLQTAGANIVEPIKFVKYGGFFSGKPSDEEKKEILDWAHDIVNKI